MVSGLKSKDYGERLEELGLTDLTERRHQIDMAQTFKIISGKDRESRDSWLKKASDNERLTGHQRTQ